MVRNVKDEISIIRELCCRDFSSHEAARLKVFRGGLIRDFYKCPLIDASDSFIKTILSR